MVTALMLNDGDISAGVLMSQSKVYILNILFNSLFRVFDPNFSSSCRVTYIIAMSSLIVC